MLFLNSILLLSINKYLLIIKYKNFRLDVQKNALEKYIIYLTIKTSTAEQ